MEPIDDLDRDRVIAELRRRHAAGYLDTGGLNHRVEVALHTTDATELNALIGTDPLAEGQYWRNGPADAQQLMPYRPAAAPGRRPAGAPAKVWRLLDQINTWQGKAAIIGTLLIFVLATGSAHISRMLILFVVIAIVSAVSNRRSGRSRKRCLGEPTTPGEPGMRRQVQDRYRSDDDRPENSW